MAIAIGLLKTLLELSRAQKSGVVDATITGARVRLFLEEGDIVFADAGTVDETLGRILVRERVLTQEQYIAALEWMADIRGRGKASKLGEVFVELGMLSPQQVHAALSAQVQQKVVRALGWTNAQPTVMESYGPLDTAERFPTALEPLVVAALRLAPEQDVQALFAQAMGRYIELADAEDAAAFGFRPDEQAFLRLLDGSRTAAELLGSPDPEEPAVILASLLLFDLLGLHAVAKAPRRASIPRPLPAIRRTSSGPPKTRTLEFGAVRQTSRPPPFRPSSTSTLRAPAPTEKERARTVTMRLKSARDAKRSLPPPPQYELAIPTPQTPVAPIARLLAEKAFQSGKSLVRANEMTQALSELRRACVMYPAAEYELWACWAALRVEGATPARIEEVRRTAHRALEQDPQLGFGLFVLGHLALRQGDVKRANELFARARAIEPSTVEELRDIRFRQITTAKRTLTFEGATISDRESKPTLPAPPSERPKTVPIPPSPPPPLPAPRVEDDAPPTEPSAGQIAIAASTPSGEVEASPTSHSSRPPAAQARGERSHSILAASVAALLMGGLIVGIAWAGRTFAPRSEADAAVVTVVTTAVEASVEVDAGSEFDASNEADLAAATTTLAELDASTTELDDPTPDASPADSASASSDADLEASAVAPTMGALDFPAAADTHRVYVDGRLVGAPPAPIAAPCGKHVVRVGSAGRDQEIDIPCGGRIGVPYP